MSAKIMSLDFKLSASTETVHIHKNHSNLSQNSSSSYFDDEKLRGHIVFTRPMEFRNITLGLINSEADLQVDVNVKHSRLLSLWNVIATVKMPLKRAVMNVMKETIPLHSRQPVFNKLLSRDDTKIYDDRSLSIVEPTQSNNSHCEPDCLHESFSWTEYLLKQSEVPSTSLEYFKDDEFEENDDLIYSNPTITEDEHEEDNNWQQPIFYCQILPDGEDCESSISSSSSSSYSMSLDSSFQSAEPRSDVNKRNGDSNAFLDKIEELNLDPKLMIDCDEDNDPLELSHHPKETRVDLSDHLLIDSTRIVLEECEESSFIVDTSRMNSRDSSNANDFLVLQLEDYDHCEETDTMKCFSPTIDNIESGLNINDQSMET